jgi:hypothetical protein
VVRQWLLFDPISEADAVGLFNDLIARTPVLALRKQWALQVTDGELQKSPPEHKGVFNGPSPTLVPSEFTPSPAWAGRAVKRGCWAAKHNRWSINAFRSISNDG